MGMHFISKVETCSLEHILLHDLQGYSTKPVADDPLPAPTMM